MASKPPFAGEKVKVSEVFDLQMGKTPSRKNLSYWNNGDYDWVSIKDLGRYDRFVGRTKETISELGRVESGIKPVPANTLLMSFKLSIGKTAITTRETYTNEAIMAFLDRGYYDFDLGYMWHQFRSKDWMAGTNVAVMGKTLNKQTLGNAIINLPAMSDQLTIARQLDEVHALTDLTKNRLRMLDQLIKSRFVEMFGDPSDNPLGWRRESLLALGDCKNGMNYRADDSGYNVLSLGVADFKDRAFLKDMSLLSRVSISEKPKESYLLKDGDIIFVRSNGNKELVGRCLAVFPGESEVIFSGFCIRLRLHNDCVRMPFLLWTLKQPSMRRKMFGRGANVQNLNQEILGNLQVPLPPLAKQDEFLSFVTQVDKSRFVVQRQIEKLQTLYDSLAQEYFGD